MYDQSCTDDMIVERFEALRRHDGLKGLRSFTVVDTAHLSKTKQRQLAAPAEIFWALGKLDEQPNDMNAWLVLWHAVRNLTCGRLPLEPNDTTVDERLTRSNSVKSLKNADANLRVYENPEDFKWTDAEWMIMLEKAVLSLRPVVELDVPTSRVIALETVSV